ncbi:MAG: NAD(P)/FAD-dependent oxidoreductase, partial [Bacteroidota bacterium]
MSDLGLKPGTRPHIVIVGAGHGGLECLQALESAAVDVTLVDRNNYHKFQPLLYQVATAGLGVDDITQPIRHMARKQANAQVRLGLAEHVDPERRVLVLDSGDEIQYDVLVLGPGASTAYYGVEGAFKHGYPVKNVPDAVALRSHVLRQFESVSRDPSLIDQGVLSFVVVGGGPTGVEMTGALRELFGVLRRDFPAVDVEKARVVLVDGATLPLNGYQTGLREYVLETLEAKGAEIQLGQNVSSVDANGVTLEDGSRIDAQTVVWAAGVRANPLCDRLATAHGWDQAGGGRLVVDETLRVPGEDRIFVVGDASGSAGPDGELYPQVAQVAIQQGKHAARLIESMVSGDFDRAPFQYDDLGQMATIGRNSAVLQMPGGLALRGWIAWMGWLLVHLVKLVGFRNRIAVFVNWVYNYFTYDRGPRLILTADRGEPVAPPVLAAATESLVGVG